MAPPLNSSSFPNGEIKGVLAHVGVVRSEILVFSILGCILLNVFARFESSNALHDVMAGAGILMLFLGFAFYCYAYLRLPRSSQERVFAEQALPEIARTKRAIRAAAHAEAV